MGDKGMLSVNALNLAEIKQEIVGVIAALLTDDNTSREEAADRLTSVALELSELEKVHLRGLKKKETVSA